MKKKIEITDTLSMYEKETLQDLVDRYGADASVMLAEDSDYYSTWNILQISYFREETDMEYNKRLKFEESERIRKEKREKAEILKKEKAKKLAEEREYKKYLSLKKKYEKGKEE